MDLDSSSSSSDSIESPSLNKKKYAKKLPAVRIPAFLLSKQPALTPKSIPDTKGADKGNGNGDSGAGGAVTAMPTLLTPGMTISGNFLVRYLPI